MLVLLLLAVAIAAAVVSLVSLSLGRSRRFDDVARFHRARAMTTEWSRASVSRPVVGPQPTPETAAREVVDH